MPTRITANHAFGQFLEDLAMELVKQGGGEIKGALRYPFPNTADFRPTWRRQRPAALLS